ERRRMAGEVPVGRGAVARRAVMDAADDGQLTGVAGDAGEVFGKFHAADGGADGPELAADVAGGLGLGVEGVEVAHPAPGEEDDAGLRLAEAAGAGAGQSGVLEGEQCGQTQDACADAEEVPSRQEGIHAHQVPSSPMASPAPALLMRVSCLCYASRHAGE